MNVCINPNKTDEFPTYYQDIFIRLGKHFSSLLSILPSTVASQCLWLNKYIKIDDKTIFSPHYLLKVLTLWVSSFKTIEKMKNGMKSRPNWI